MARHLPPSAAELHLLDIGGVAGPVLSGRRRDLVVQEASVIHADWDYPANSFDAVMGYDLFLRGSLLQQVLRLLRPGGRFIVVHPTGSPEASHVERLEKAGYVRILVEAAYENAGVLIRGERKHETVDTLERVRVAADGDLDELDWSQYRGRYVHVLVRQTPNKPVWRMTPQDAIRWEAVAVTEEDHPNDAMLLAFSSLPKAVAFMQPAVLENYVQDVNKVGKFTITAAQTWTMPLLLNPTLDSIRNRAVQMIEIDPTTAEDSDE